MIEFWTAITHGLAILGTILMAAVWHWTPSRAQSRGNTFFGVRVEDGFARSEMGAAILHQFHLRLWLCTAGAAAGSLLMPLHFAVFAGFLGSSLAGMGAFILAHRRAQREAPRSAEPALRVASVAVEKNNEAAWLGVLDWLGIIVPLLAPTATLVFLAQHKHQLTDPVRAEPLILFGWVLCFMSAFTQWALRFRARSSDWTTTPGTSHKYRTYLGLSQGTVFTFITWQMCTLAVIQLNGTVAWLRHLDISTYFFVSLPVQALWVVLIWKMRFWLKKHLATESSDPMADSCWRWGYFYFNRIDPALVVPLRAGVGQSFNYARPSVWVVTVAVTVMMIVALSNR